MTRLEILNLGFDSSEVHPVQTSQPLLPPTRTVFPFLTRFLFQGIGEYLAARIDAPLLSQLHMLLFHWPFSSTVFPLPSSLLGKRSGRSTAQIYSLIKTTFISALGRKHGLLVSLTFAPCSFSILCYADVMCNFHPCSGASLQLVRASPLGFGNPRHLRSSLAWTRVVTSHG